MSIYEKSTESRIFEIRDMLTGGLTDEESLLRNLPFAIDDATAGCENEYQTAVEGNPEDVDLPLTILNSNYFKNISRFASRGESTAKKISRVEEFIQHNNERIWENSWLRIPLNRLEKQTRELLMSDLKLDKTDPTSQFRPDFGNFFLEKNGERVLRIPSSYLLRLSLFDACLCGGIIESSALKLITHYLNDNSSPETFSFTPVSSDKNSTLGSQLAYETLTRYLLSQLSVMYANRKFTLESTGQKLHLYFSPNTPVRMKKLNSLISDSFYRELFMSPCLAGWNKGYEKFAYMHLCHQVLSRSHLNSAIKLRESGILNSHLVRLDSISNTSLANNGTHVSIGSRMLGERAAEGRFTREHEKYAGDLAIKIFEHFLPLFAGNYSASPARFSYADFRPERMIGFLSHELDYSHLRMLWRRWTRKAGLERFGTIFIPDGPDWYEKIIERIFFLKGDLVPDARVTDYLVALMSTKENPALNGMPGNDRAVKRDLAEMGIFDERMSLYLPFKMREYASIGFSGFEARYYSQFESITTDMKEAVDLQHLITAFAYHQILSSRISHGDIPDDPYTESERRQIFFSGAIGVKSVNVRINSSNRFLNRILSFGENIKQSKRYSGQNRVRLTDYNLSLIRLLRSDAALIEMFNANELLSKAEERILSREATSAKLISSINAGRRKSPLETNSDEFNSSAEQYYRSDLRTKNMTEAIDLLIKKIDQQWNDYPSELASEVLGLTGNTHPCIYLSQLRDSLLSDSLSLDDVTKTLRITAAQIFCDIRAEHYKERRSNDASVYRQKTVGSGDGEDISRQTH